MGLTLFEKLWRAHLVEDDGNGQVLLYVDRHLVYEVTSPQAFEALRLADRKAWRAQTILATCDHNVPTTNRADGVRDPLSRIQIETLEANCNALGVSYFGLDGPRQGIVHVIGPEQGATLPGMVVVCGDSHTSTHGAFAALAFGVGTSEVEHVLATQCLRVAPMRTMRVMVSGVLPFGVSAKDLILAIIGRVGASGGVGHAIEFTGSAVEGLSMEGRMTLCNMAIEGGARVGLVAVDDKTIDYVRGRPLAPKGEMFERAEAYWRTLRSDPGAIFAREVELNASDISPQVTWGTSPDKVISILGAIPDPAAESDPVERESMIHALDYMGLAPGVAITDVSVDKVFIGSCTNGRIEDLRVAAEVLRGRRVAATVRLALAVPGSGLVKRQAEAEGLDVVFRDAGFEWREPGCSMCLGMNEDRLSPGERCASTSNRNFEGRQGQGGRSHLVSPATAAATAIAGKFADVRALDLQERLD